MSNDTKDEYDFSKLDNLIRTLKNNKTTVKVGILGTKNARTGPNPSNATIGAVHEFGTTNVPRRSFLRMPLTENLHKELEKQGAFNEKDMIEIIQKSSMQDFSKKIGTIAVATVLKAFDSGGFGQWEALKPETLAHKKVKQTLVESHQLRDSITFEVKQQK